MCRVLFRDVDSLPVDLNTIYYYLAYVAWRYVGDEDRRARGCWIILSSPPPGHASGYISSGNFEKI